VCRQAIAINLRCERLCELQIKAGWPEQETGPVQAWSIRGGTWGGCVLAGIEGWSGM